MRRLQLFEFNDQAWLPPALRESVPEILGRAGRWGHFLAGVAPVFAHFLEEARSDEVLDLCSGTGDPVCALLEELARRRMPLPHVLLTDLFPNPRAWARAAARFPGRVGSVGAPVDARHIAPSLRRPVRTLINALHHFPPPVVEEILAGCVRDRAAIFVSEAFPRALGPGSRAFLPCLAATLVNPLLAPQGNLVKALATYVLPLIPALGLFDYVASVFRIHTPGELLAIGERVAPHYLWRHGLAPFPGGGRAMYFFGLPRC